MKVGRLATLQHFKCYRNSPVVPFSIGRMSTLFHPDSPYYQTCCKHQSLNGQTYKNDIIDHKILKFNYVSSATLFDLTNTAQPPNDMLECISLMQTDCGVFQ